MAEENIESKVKYHEDDFFEFARFLRENHLYLNYGGNRPIINPKIQNKNYHGEILELGIISEAFASLGFGVSGRPVGRVEGEYDKSPIKVKAYGRRNIPKLEKVADYLSNKFNKEAVVELESE